MVKKGLNPVPFLFGFCFLFVVLDNAFALSLAQIDELAKSKEWQSLLRYERPLLGFWSKDSAIRDSDFFLSPTGKFDPVSELKATLVAFKKPFTKFKNPNQHALCRFPARYRWIKQRIDFPDRSSELKKCSDYQRWSHKGGVKSISIYFATGYFGNPASFFGHPLLKFNREGLDSNFVDTSLNYGAMTPVNENPIFYVLKGLFGGYTASFTRHDFFYHNHNYSETEMRDLWEYRLNLDPPEVQAVVDRTWELLGKSHPYYFLVDNCAYRIAELLEDVLQQPLFFRNRLYVIPIDIFDNLEKKVRRDGRPIVKEINVVPSRFTRLTEMFAKLDDQEKAIVQSVVDAESENPRGQLKERNPSSQARVVETLINYYSFRKLKDKDDVEVEAQRVQMIRERFSIKAKSGFQSMAFSKASAPHDSVNSFGLGLSQGYGDKMGSFQELTIRPALYDELNPTKARPANTSLEIFKTQARINDSKIQLRSMELFRVSTIDSSVVALPETRNLSWKMRLGLRSQTQACADCLVAFAEGGVGLSRPLWKGAHAFALVKAGLQNNRNDQGTVFLLPEVGVFSRILENWKLFAAFEYEKFVSGLQSEFPIWTVESRFGSSQWWDLRVKYQKRDDEQILATIWFYL